MGLGGLNWHCSRNWFPAHFNRRPRPDHFPGPAVRRWRRWCNVYHCEQPHKKAYREETVECCRQNDIPSSENIRDRPHLRVEEEDAHHVSVVQPCHVSSEGVSS